MVVERNDDRTWAGVVRAGGIRLLGDARFWELMGSLRKRTALVQFGSIVPMYAHGQLLLQIIGNPQQLRRLVEAVCSMRPFADVRYDLGSFTNIQYTVPKIDPGPLAPVPVSDPSLHYCLARATRSVGL